MSTVAGCFRYRVSGLAAEAAFFAVLSLPPLVFGLAGTIGYVAGWFGDQTVGELRTDLITLAEQVLTPNAVQEVLVPTLDEVLAAGRADVISLGFVIALWSGSRALNVFIDTITIMYGLGGRRGIVTTRALSFALYLVALLIGVLLIPLVLAGPDLVSGLVPPSLGWLTELYWPFVLMLTVVFLTSLYHLAVPVRTPWVVDLPGAALALAIWVGGSLVLRWFLSQASGSTSIYGPLAAPIAVLVWLYLVSIAVLIGAALNAAWDQVWPSRETDKARHEPASRPADNPVTQVPGSG